MTTPSRGAGTRAAPSAINQPKTAASADPAGGSSHHLETSERPDTPRNLRLNGLDNPLGVAADDLTFSWSPDPQQSGAHVVLTEHDGTTTWDSRPVATSSPEIRFNAALLASRMIYRWRVRITSADGKWSPWSEEGEFETALLRLDDWAAQWIGRATPPGQRIMRSISSDTLSWIAAGHSLGQSFDIAGPMTGINVDLTAEFGEEVSGRLEVVDTNGVVVVQRDLRSGPLPWFEFGTYLECTDPLPAGRYDARITSERGRIGWRTLTTVPSSSDDGVSPLPVLGRATRDGMDEPGVRAIGIDTRPAPNPIFRATFSIPVGFSRPRLYGVGLGFGKFLVNGRPVTADVLEPPPTAYDRTILYRTYDLTEHLVPGTNTVTAELGRGFYATRGASIWAWHLAPWNREPVLIAQIEYRDADGVTQQVTSNTTWETAEGSVRAEVLYSGEIQDPAHENRSSWAPAVVVTPPGGQLIPTSIPPIRRFSPISPVSSHSTGTATVHDFGSVIAGRVRCVVSGPSLAEIGVKYGEYLSIDGMVVCDNILATGEAQIDTFVLPPGADLTTWEPEFSYKGFRYVGVEASDGVTLHDIQAIPLHTDVRRVGEFDCQNETLTWVVAATERTFLNNLHGIPTDTPIYEKNGWTADAHLVSESVLHSFDLRSLFKKWLDDHVDSQQPDGVVPQIVPSPGWGSAPDPAWSASMVLIPWNLYWEYGDLSILERYATSILRYTGRLLEISGNGLWPLHSWGDWLAPGFELAPEGAVPTATMMLHHVASRTSLICQELGFIDLADHYRQAAKDVADAYHHHFFDHQSGHYAAPGVGYRQTMNVLPLAFGAVPEQHVRSVANSLIGDIETRTAGHLDCGAIGVKYLLPVLTEHGRPDLAITVASQETRPGWGVWRKAGAQTLMESWDTTARSLNHYFLGSSAAWIQQRIAGLRATAPGWKCFDVSPVLDTRINRARIVHDSIRGPVSVEWSRSDNQMDVHLVVPPGATARLALPKTSSSLFKSGSYHVALALDQARTP